MCKLTLVASPKWTSSIGGIENWLTRTGYSRSRNADQTAEQLTKRFEGYTLLISIDFNLNFNLYSYSSIESFCNNKAVELTSIIRVASKSVVSISTVHDRKIILIPHDSIKLKEAEADYCAIS